MKHYFYAYKRRRNITLIIGGISLGKVKTEQIKRTGKELMTRFPNKFSSNFEENKKLVNALISDTTTRVRNKVAGYITRTVALSESGSEIEVDESDDDIDED
ncbi:MAG: 30S ribosomal protein S17e [Candidatus Bathyarchaeota archaeon]|uniref:30S ribosomal protein S17e n=1 Tax=Candidatus Bathycorpusculum sp. TaxID=2994959 RepID=UPI002835BC43|nr:30S ribosomal protein S17e [Candidatus Termiticorpusculum sp.]MCL2292999.1 30S ribosomal protein S17e [Candidatus Termiticorpusculum sp.]